MDSFSKASRMPCPCGSSLVAPSTKTIETKKLAQLRLRTVRDANRFLYRKVVPPKGASPLTPPRIHDPRRLA